MASIFKMCGKYLIKNKYSVICYGVLCLTSSMFSMISPYISGNFIDYLIVADNISKIYRYCFAFFGLFVFNQLIGYIVNRVYIKMQTQMGYDLNSDVIRHMTFVQLLECLNYHTIDLSEVKGISYRVGQEIIHNADRGYIENLDNLPWAELDEIEMRSYDIKQLIITSRGCPGKCIYCASAALSGTRYRNRSAQNVFSEIHYKYSIKGEKYFAFLDDTFTANKKRLYQFCDYLKQANMNIIWRCDSRTDILSKEMIDKMQEVGCTSVHIGIESGSQDVINKINKHISLERSEELLAYMSQKGLQVMCSFIIGHHCDTHETIKETIDMALKFRKKYKATVGISINTPFPGTYLYNHMKDLGINLEIKNWSSFDLVQAVFSTPNITRAELQNYYYEIQSMVI